MAFTPHLGAVWLRAQGHFLLPVWGPAGLGCIAQQPCSSGRRAGLACSVGHLCPFAGVERGLVVRPSLESLLAASSHVLKEVLDGPFGDSLRNLRLPRELNPNKKYSWMQKKEERVSPSGPVVPACGPWDGAETGSPGRPPCLGVMAGFGGGEGLTLIHLLPPTCFSAPGRSFPLSGPQSLRLMTGQEHIAWRWQADLAVPITACGTWVAAST